MKDIQEQFEKAAYLIRDAADYTQRDEVVMKIIAAWTGLKLPPIA